MSRATTFQKSVLVFIVIFVGGSMVFYFGNPGGGPGGADQVGATEVLAQVGDQTITAVEFRQQLAQAAQQRRQFTGEDVTYEQMAMDGTAQDVLDSLVTAKIVQAEAAKDRLSLDRETLVKYLKQEPAFQNEQGQFDAARWNQWVQTQKGAINWTELYREVEWALSQQAHGELVKASARVLDSEVRELYADQHTQLSVRYVAVSPEIEITEAELLERYEANREMYTLPAERKVALVSISLEPPRPAVVDEVVAAARAGQDFGELVAEYSTVPTKEQGGELGWLRPGMPMQEQQKVVFDLGLGEISDPVADRGVYSIYRVDEERTDPVTAQREVKVRVIGIRGELSDEEKAARMATAQAVAQAAKDAGDLRAAAAANGLEVKESGFFSMRSAQIGDVPSADGFALRQAFENTEGGQISDVIEGPENLYVGQVIEVKPPAPQSFEEVRDQVARTARQEVQNTEAFQERLRTYAEQIVEQAQNLEDIPRLFPELNAQIETTRPFTVNDYLATEGLFWNNQQIFQELRGKDPGTMIGPIADMLGGKFYFVELAERVAPAEDIWGEQWENAKAQLRDSLQRQRDQEFAIDYMANLRAQAEQTVPIMIDQDLFTRILGLGQQEGDAVPDEGAAAPATDEVPAEPAE